MRAPTIRSLESLSQVVTANSHPLCLFSGGLDGAYMLYTLTKLPCNKITALTVNLGGGLRPDNLELLCQKLGVRPLIVDKQQEFSDDFVIPAIAAQACYLGGHPICASLSRPLMAKAACDEAQKSGCDIIVHTSNRSQNSLRRFNGAFSSLGFQGHFGSAYELSPMLRDQKRKILSAAGFSGFEDRMYSIDSNFWGREFESGDLDDPENLVLPESLYQWTKIVPDTPAQELAITFRHGIPCGINGTEMAFVSLVSELNLLIGAYGLGRYAGLEEIDGGAKVQEIREMPAAFVLLDAYRRLESCCLSAECIREKMHVEQLWVREAVEGRWFDPSRKAAHAFIKTMAQEVNGVISYELGLRSLKVLSTKTEKPLYIRDRSEYEHGFLFNKKQM